jgi:hypothetical protein
MIARYAPAELKVDTSKLSPGDQQALKKLIEAAKVIDDIFLRFVWRSFSGIGITGGEIERYNWDTVKRGR